MLVHRISRKNNVKTIKLVNSKALETGDSDKLIVQYLPR
jgi:hypothetical protein